MGKVGTDEASRWLRRIYEHIAATTNDVAMRTVRVLSGSPAAVALPELGQRHQQSGDRDIRVVPVPADMSTRDDEAAEDRGDRPETRSASIATLTRDVAASFVPHGVQRVVTV